MLNKVRARHGIDLPVEGWKRSTALSVILMTLAALFVLVPLAVVLVKGLVSGFAAVVILGLASLVLGLFGSSLFLR